MDNFSSLEASLDTLAVVAYPGAGKGTLLKAFKEQFKDRAEVFEVGAMVRSEIRENTEFGKLAKDYSSRGTLIPDQIIVAKIREAIEELDPDKFWFLDGFPRNQAQIDPYTEMMTQHGRQDMILHLQLPPEKAAKIAEQRLLEARELDRVTAHFEKLGMVIRVDASQPVIEVHKAAFTQLQRLLSSVA